MPASEYLEGQILGHLFRAATWAKPTVLWVGLLLATPEDSGGLVEVSAPEYLRIQRDPSEANWLVSASGEISNAEAIAFAEPDPEGLDWSTTLNPVKALGLFDAATGGNLIAYTILDSAKVVTAGGPLLMFQPGALKWKMNDL